MRNLRDYCCEKCGTVQERFVDNAVVQVDCACGAIANRIIGKPHIRLDGTDPAFPTAYEHWGNIREENARIKARRKES